MNRQSERVNKHDYLVVGAGAGGLLVAVGLQKFGKDVVVVSENIGGDCTNFGCVPSKTLLHLAGKYHSLDSKEEKATLKNSALKKVRETVETFIAEEEELIATDRYFPGKAHFVSKNTVEVVGAHGTQTIKFRKKCIIATGSRPVRIKLDGVPEDKIITNEELFYLDTLPSSITIFGGGPIGAEMATACAHFGITTYLVSRSYLNKEPAEIAKRSLQELKKIGVQYVSARPVKVEKNKLLLDTGKTIPKTELYLSATGRIPNVELNLEAAEVQYDRTGIETTSNLITSNKRIFAIGDVGQNPQFTHLAASHGKFVMKKIMFPLAKRKERALPRVTFTSPFIASVGSVAQTSTSKIFELDFAASDTGRTRFDTKSYGLVSVDKNNGKLLGASLYGHFSADLINLFTLMIDEQIPVIRLADFITPYPTYANVLHKVTVEYLQFLSASFKKNPVRTAWLLRKYL